ncbi:WD40-repeat-containing domain protein [Schizophyllum fasciatum]
MAEINPIAKSVMSLLDLGVEELTKRMEYHDDILLLVDKISDASQVVLSSDKRGFTEYRTEQLNARNALIPQIYRALSLIQSLASQSIAGRLRTEVNERVQELRRCLQNVMDNVESGERIDMQNSVFRLEDIATRLDIDNVLGHLPAAPGVQSGSSRACLPNTRVRLLNEIMEWVFSPASSRGLFLRGMAGMGKSAVAHRVTRLLADMGVPAPFFAFDRTRRAGQANQLFPTLAKQLARHDQQYLETLRALHAHQLESLDIQDQHTYLVSTSLCGCTPLVPIIFVIDALDECPNVDADSSGQRSTLLKMLQKCLADTHLHHYIRFFVTTRPDQDICNLFLGPNIPIGWRSIDDAEGTEMDIRTFVDSQLVNTSVSELGDVITEAAQAHFECAAILCRELTGPRRPMTASKRHQLVERVKTEPGRPLYKTYRVILETHLDIEDKVCVSIYRQLLAWILLVREPQRRPVCQEIAKVVLPKEDVKDIIEGLGSLLSGTSVGDETPIRPLHASFRDFSLDPEESGIYNIAAELASGDAQMAYACFRLMNRPRLGLRSNLCDLPSPFVFKEDVDNLSDRIARYATPGLRYACLHGYAHLDWRSLVDLNIISEVEILLTAHSLHWLEACGWLDAKPGLALAHILQWARASGVPNIIALVEDCVAFEKRYREAITSSPPQVYQSGLLFSPRLSQVRRLNIDRFASPVLIYGIVLEEHWPADEVLVIPACGEVRAISLSPDGLRIACGCGDNTVRFWDTETGQQLGDALRGHTEKVCAVMFSSDGTRLVSGSCDHTVRLWDVATGHQLHVASHGRTGWVWSVAFSPDGKHYLTNNPREETVYLWDVETGEQVDTILDISKVWSLAFSPDSKYLVTGSEDKLVRVWHIEAHGQLVSTLRGHNDRVWSVTFSPNGTRIASGSGDASVRIWDGRACWRQQGGTLRGHTSAVRCIAFSPDGMRLVSSSADCTVRVWDVENGQQIGVVLCGHTDEVRSVAFSPSGTKIISGARDKTVRVWNAEMGSQIGSNARYALDRQNGPLCVAFSPGEGDIIASGHLDATVRVWSARTGEQLGMPWRGHAEYIGSVAFSPDGKCVASGSSDGDIRLWDVRTGKLLGKTIRAANERICTISFSPDGSRIVSGSADHAIRVWTAETGQQYGTDMLGHKGQWVTFATFSPDGNRIASNSGDNTVHIWDAQTSVQVACILLGRTSLVRSIAFSPDRSRLLFCAEDQTVRVWDVVIEKELGDVMRGHEHEVDFAAFAPDGTHVVSASRDQTMRIWQATGTSPHLQIAVMYGHSDWVKGAAFSPNGARIVSASYDWTIRLWNAALAQEVAQAEQAGANDARLARIRIEERIRERYGWLVHEHEGRSRPILWIPHHFRQSRLAYSPYQVSFIPPVTYIRVSLEDSFDFDAWPLIGDTGDSAKVSV